MTLQTMQSIKLQEIADTFFSSSVRTHPFQLATDSESEASQQVVIGVTNHILAFRNLVWSNICMSRQMVLQQSKP